MKGNRFELMTDGATPLVMNANTVLLTGGADKGANPQQWELEHFRESCYTLPDGGLIIPAANVRKCLIAACKFVPDRPRGNMRSFGPLIEAALIVEEDIRLDVGMDKVIPWTVVVNLDPSKGPRGPRGPRTRPMIRPPWRGQTTLMVLDERLTEDVLEKISYAAGWKCGLCDARTIQMGRSYMTVRPIKG
jgi:hypothetical protein